MRCEFSLLFAMFLLFGPASSIAAEPATQPPEPVEVECILLRLEASRALGKDEPVASKPSLLGPLRESLGVGTGHSGHVVEDRAALLAAVATLEKAGSAKVLLRARLAAVTGTTASASVGVEEAVPKSKNGDVSVVYSPIGTTISCLPRWTEDRRLMLELKVTDGHLEPVVGKAIQGHHVQGRSQQSFMTTLVVDDGKTFVLLGSCQQELSVSRKGAGIERFEKESQLILIAKARKIAGR